MAKIARLLESFEEGVLGGFVHGVSRCDDEKTVGLFSATSESEETADLFDGDGGGFLFVFGAEVERVLDVELRLIRYDKNTTADVGSDLRNRARLVEEHAQIPPGEGR